MRQTIWKFDLPFPVTDRFVIEMPHGSTILCVDMQMDEPRIWALVDPEAEMSHKQFELYGTGHPIDGLSFGQRKYIGTFQIVKLGLVFHLFETITGKSKAEGI